MNLNAPDGTGGQKAETGMSLLLQSGCTVRVVSYVTCCPVRLGLSPASSPDRAWMQQTSWALWRWKSVASRGSCCNASVAGMY